MTDASHGRWLAATLVPLAAIALATGRAGPALLLVAAGAAMAWPALARHGHGAALAALVALVYATPAYGIALEDGWWRAAAFVAAAALVRAASAPAASLARVRILWRAAAAAALLVLLARGGAVEAVVDGLFSSGDGLLFWSPVLWLALAGTAAAGTVPSRALPAALLCAAAATVDPGEHAGARFAPVIPLLAPGLARAFAALRDASARRPLVPVLAGAAAFVVWNALLMAQYRGGGVPRDDTVAFARVARNAAALVSGTVGSPPAWPANWIFAARHGVAAARWDLLGGVDLFDGPRGLGGVMDVGNLATDEALLEAGWSVRHPCGAEVCRAVEGAATLLAPVRAPRDVELAVTASGQGPLTVSINGVAVLVAPLGPDLVARRVRVPRARLRRGMNAIALSVPPGGRALVDRIVLAESPSPRARAAPAGGPA